MKPSPIVTLTFSPCIDKSTSIDTLLPEKKLRCKAPVLEPGGGGINVARAISHLGADVLAVYPAGGYTGQYFNHLLAKENINVQIIETASETRENIIVLDEAANLQYRFGMPGTPLLEAEWKQCLEVIDALDGVQYIVASGSLPPGVPTDVYALLAQVVKRKKARLIVDTSGDALKQAADEGVYLLKPNLGELASLSGIDEIPEHQAATIARKIIQSGKTELILLSMGASGALIVSAGETYRIFAPVVDKKSTVGAGDSMVGGLLFALWRGDALVDAARYAVAAGTAATLNPGTALCRKNDVDRLFPQTKAALIPIGQTI
jgi:6-phosphofructokinase 2